MRDEIVHISFYSVITYIMAVIIFTPGQRGHYYNPKQTESGSLLFLLYERHHIVLQFHYIDLIVPLCLFWHHDKAWIQGELCSV